MAVSDLAAPASKDDARCANHADSPVVATCSRCGKFLCSDCVWYADQCTECVERERLAMPSGHARAQFIRWLLFANAAVDLFCALCWAIGPGAALGAKLNQFEPTLTTLFSIVIGIWFLVWLHLVVRHLRLRLLVHLKPGTVVTSWFIPLVNLVRPYEQVKQMCAALKVSDSTPLRLWWTTWLSASLTGTVLYVQGQRGSIDLRLYVIDHVIAAASAVLCAIVVGTMQAAVEKLGPITSPRGP
jgi:hypothetical protein